MTLALLFGGLVILALALWVARGAKSAGPLGPTAPPAFVAAWPVLCIALLWFAYGEGTRTAADLDNGIRLVGKTRIAVTEVSFNREGADQSVRIGGDATSDDIVISGLPAGAILLSGDDENAFIEQRTAQWEQGRLEVFLDGTLLAVNDRRGLASGVSIRMGQRDTAKPPAETVDDLNNVQGLTVDHSRSQWKIAFGAPDFLVVEPGSIQPASADIANQPREGDNVAPFKSIGGRFAPLLSSTEVVLPEAYGQSTLVIGNGERGEFSNDRVVIQGSGLRVVMRIDPLNLKGGLRGISFWLAFWAVLVSVAITWKARRESALVASVLGLAELLLILRILLAIEGTMVEETLRSRNALPDSLVALPMGMLALAMVSQSGKQLWLAVGAYLAVLAAMLFQVGDKFGTIPGTSWNVVYSMGTMAGLLLFFRSARRPIAALYDRFRTLASQLPLRLTVMGEWREAIISSFGMGIGILVIRLLLWGLGIKERVFVGGQSIGATSLLVIPLTLVAVLPLFTKLARHNAPDSEWVGGLAFGGFLALFVLLPNAVIAGDTGLAIVLVVSLAFFALCLRGYGAPKNGNADTAAVLLVSLGLILGLSTFLVGNRDLSSWMVPIGLLGTGALLAAFAWWRQGSLPEQLAVKFLWALPAGLVAMAILVTSVPSLQPELRSPPDDASALQSGSRSELRLAGALASERLGLFSSQEGENFREAQRDIAMYADTDQGRGYLNVPVIRPSIRGQQFSDFAVAVHFVSPFGRMALAGLLVLLAVPLIFVWIRLSHSGGRVLVGAMALSVFIFTSTYIALVNLLLAPMTGRNFYLLAPQSLSDLTEGIALLGLGLLSLSLAWPSPRHDEGQAA